MDSWGDIPGKWSTEMHSLRNILIDGGFANDEGNIVIEEMGDLDSVNYVQLDAISLNIDISEILQDVLAEEEADINRVREAKKQIHYEYHLKIEKL